MLLYRACARVPGTNALVPHTRSSTPVGDGGGDAKLHGGVEVHHH